MLIASSFVSDHSDISTISSRTSAQIIYIAIRLQCRLGIPISHLLSPSNQESTQTYFSPLSMLSPSYLGNDCHLCQSLSHAPSRTSSFMPPGHASPFNKPIPPQSLTGPSPILQIAFASERAKGSHAPFHTRPPTVNSSQEHN
jgi:hypothetical protein